MSLLAKQIPNDRGIYSGEFTTYGRLGAQFPRARGLLNFEAALNEPDAPYTGATYERVVMLMTGGFAD